MDDKSSELSNSYDELDDSYELDNVEYTEIISPEIPKNPIYDEMTRLAKLLNIGDESGFNPGSFRVMIDLLNKNISFLVVLRIWYTKYYFHPEWSDFFEKTQHGWLWSLYKDNNKANLTRLSNFLLENPTTA